MWVITVYSKENHITMFEFGTEQEAREVFQKLQGCKILTEVVCVNAPCLAMATV